MFASVRVVRGQTFLTPPRAWLLTAAALAAPTLALADTTGQSTPVSGVVVTATQLPTRADEAPDLIVINRAEIEARQAVYAADVLSTVPGVALSDNGGFGGVTSVRLRGASSDKTLVLIDGVPQNDPSQPAGAYDFSSLDLTNVERIEVLEGPQSSIWGSDAIGGVISITSREFNGWTVQGEGGSLTSFDGQAAFGQKTDRYAFGGSIFGDRSDGVAKADGIGPRNPFWQWSGGLYGRLTPNDWLTLDTHWRYERSYAAVDGYDANTFAFGYTPQYYDTHGWTGDVRAIANGPLGFTETLTVGLAGLDRSNVYVGSPANTSAYWAFTQDYRLTAERGAPSDAFGVILGGERLISGASISTGQRLDLGTSSGFVEARWRPWAPLTLTAAGRYDAPDAYKGQATGHVSAVLKLPAGFALESALGQGFKTPTLSEIACDFCFPGGPSLNLQPEHAWGWDGALAWTEPGGRATIRLTGYHLSVTDELAFANSFPFRYLNIGRTRTDGAELEADVKLTDELTLQGEYAYTDAYDITDATQMIRVPRDAGSATLIWKRRRWQAELTVRAEGPDADENPSTFAPQVRPGFVIARVAGAYALSPQLDLTARLEDIAGARYEEALGYGEPRQMLFIGIRARE